MLVTFMILSFMTLTITSRPDLVRTSIGAAFFVPVSAERTFGVAPMIIENKAMALMKFNVFMSYDISLLEKEFSTILNVLKRKRLSEIIRCQRNGSTWILVIMSSPNSLRRALSAAEAISWPSATLIRGLTFIWVSIIDECPLRRVRKR